MVGYLISLNGLGAISEVANKGLHIKVWSGSS